MLAHRRILPLLAFGLALGGGLLAIAGEKSPTCVPPAAEGEAAPAIAPTPAPALPSSVTLDDHGEPKGIHNYRRWSERIGQGAQPEGEEAFRNLARLGFKTLVSVDGALPAVELAQKHGLRYVHIPIGYDGVPRDAALKLLRTLQLFEGPVFFHCHHGKHRGPAACTIPAMGLEGLSPELAVERLKTSRTSAAYVGLYRDVRAFQPPTQAELEAITEADLPSAVRPEGVRAAMVQLDIRFEFLKSAQAESFTGVSGNPDISPPHEALMLEEAYREMARLEESIDSGEKFLAYTEQSEAAARRLAEAIKAKDQAAATHEMVVLANLCTACHHDFRD